MKSNQERYLETERLIMRRFTEGDADNLYELENDPQVMRYINGGIATPRNIIQDERLPVFLFCEQHNPGFGFWAVDEKSTGKFLGWVSFRPTGSNPTDVTLGFRFQKAAWGNGYAIETARALICKGFSEMNVQRVRATTYQDNLRSQRVLQKIGMTCVRKFRLTPEDLQKSDTFHVDANELWDGDDFEFALEKSEWERQQARVSQESSAFDSPD